MFDFLKVIKNYQKGRYYYKPTFITKSSIKDLMTRGGAFYAIYDEDSGYWTKYKPRAIELIDQQVREYTLKDSGEEVMKDTAHGPVILTMADSANHLVEQFDRFCKTMGDNWHALDQRMLFSNSEIKKTDYASKTLDYPLIEQPTPYYDALCNVLYLPDEREKWEWAVGSMITGDSSKIQKMFAFYGEPGTGKSTIISKIFADQVFGGIHMGYAVKFEANNLVSGNEFGTDFLENDSVLVYDDDAEMGMITVRSTLNKIISHEQIRVNAKFKAPFMTTANCMIFVGSNDPIQLSPNSGMKRRLVDIRPTGNLLAADLYDECMEHIPFEKSGIAWKCLQTYKKLGRHYYDHYIAEDMMARTSPFHNFVLENTIELKDGITLTRAYALYLNYAEMCKFKNILVRYKFRDILKLYFDKYEDARFSGFRWDKVGKSKPVETKIDIQSWLEFEPIASKFDTECSDLPAQYASNAETPSKPWDSVTTTLADISTDRLHYVKVPENHIVIDFDIPGPDGNKSFERNLEAASKFPPTYAELSKSGAGIHLHYIYEGDVSELSRVYADNIEVKVFTGKSSLRRKLTKCNNLDISTISSGLPKREKKVVNFEGFKNDKALLTYIRKCLNKEIEPKATKPSIDYIYKALEDAYNSGMHYDLSYLYNRLLIFASRSTHNADYCRKLVSKMHLKSEDSSEPTEYKQNELIFFDCEVFPNLLLVNWKVAGEGKKVHRLINPSPDDISKLVENKLVGFNCRRYDNHILYARMLGMNNEQIYDISKGIIAGQESCFFGEAYNLSYTDIYDFSSKKQSLKKFEIDLDIHHQELGLPWDQPVPEERWEEVARYCDNDVIATEAVFNARQADFKARQILAAVSGGIPNSTTNSLTTKIIFGSTQNPGLVYTNLQTGEQYGPSELFAMPIISEEEYEVVKDDWQHQEKPHDNCFPGYFLVRGRDGQLRNMYRGVDVGFGGYVYAKPGMYSRAVTYDIASMHPHSGKELNALGPYTENWYNLVLARIDIKHGDYETAKQLFAGKLAPYLENKNDAKGLSDALKIAINSVYGLTSAKFKNPFRDPRNINNIVALRGALFMKTLQDEVEARGYNVLHIKTDSIKIENPDKDIQDFVMEFGKEFGYSFEIEHTWDRLCLVNNAVYVGRHGKDDSEPDIWEAVGAEFQVPYVFKTIFSKEPLEFKDMCETKSVTSALYLDMNENLPQMDLKDARSLKNLETLLKDGLISETDSELVRLREIEAKTHDYIFIGRVGLFCPIKPGCNGGLLMRENHGKYAAATGSKGWRWLEAETVKKLNDIQQSDIIDRSYYDELVTQAIEHISEFGDFDWFVSNNAE